MLLDRVADVAVRLAWQVPGLCVASMEPSPIPQALHNYGVRLCKLLCNKYEIMFTPLRMRGIYFCVNNLQTLLLVGTL